MIHKHLLRNERYHTSLANLYLKFIFEGRKVEYFEKFHDYLRVPHAK